jgi:hypothetical protein
MLSIIIYVLTFVIIAFVLISAVVVHLLLGLHSHGEFKRKAEKSDDEDSKTLHEMIFNSSR